MAIWQFHFQLVPVREEAFSSKILDPRNSIDILCEELACGKSWSKDIRLFGSEDKTCVELLVCNAVVENISVRIDMRSITKKQLECIVKFATVNHLEMLCDGKDDNERQGVTMAHLLTAMKKSRAYKFMKDPQGFIAELHYQNMHE